MENLAPDPQVDSSAMMRWIALCLVLIVSCAPKRLPEDLIIPESIENYLVEKAKEDLEAYACLIGGDLEVLVGDRLLHVVEYVYEPPQMRKRDAVRALMPCPLFKTVGWWHSHPAGCALSGADKAHTKSKGFVWAVVFTSDGQACYWRFDQMDDSPRWLNGRE